MTDYKRGSQEEKDAQLLHDAKAFGGTIGRDLLELIERQDKQSTAMLKLLERWVEILSRPLESTGPDFASQKDTGQLHIDIKTLLKEAKVETARDAWREDVMVQELVNIIDRLNTQLAELKEAGEPLLEEIEMSAKILQKKLCCYDSVRGPGLEPSGRCDCKYIQVVRTGSTEETGCCESRQIILLSRRLAQALKEVRG